MSPTIVIVIVFGLLAIAGAGYLLTRSRASQEEEVYHFSCPGCRRRLRYREKQVGNKGQCPRCGTALAFPPVNQAHE